MMEFVKAKIRVLRIKFGIHCIHSKTSQNSVICFQNMKQLKSIYQLLTTKINKMLVIMATIDDTSRKMWFWKLHLIPSCSYCFIFLYLYHYTKTHTNVKRHKPYHKSKTIAFIIYQIK